VHFFPSWHDGGANFSRKELEALQGASVIKSVNVGIDVSNVADVTNITDGGSGGGGFVGTQNVSSSREHS
jgi:hypothetical protein